MATIKHLWHDAVWSKVIAGGLLVLAGTYYLGWWPEIDFTVGRAVDYLGKSSSLPNWLLGILWLSFSGLIVSAGVFLWAVLASNSNRPDWLAYTTDLFFGIRWRWHYGAMNEIAGLCLFCPHCDHQVFFGQSAVAGTVVRCDRCLRQIGDFKESPAALEYEVEQLIQRKIQDRGWVVQDSL